MDIFKHQGFGNMLGYGQKTALLLIDMQFYFTTEDELGGFNIWDAIDNTARLLQTARNAALPVAHVRFVAPAASGGAGVFGGKVPALHALTRDNPRTAFVDSVAPIAGEYVLDKEHASALA
ncbi:MAG: isochorismatase family protein [Pseudomonadota bacterium]